jgi:Smg protein
MKEKVVEVLIYIMSAMQDDRPISELDLAELKTQGYTPSEISAAFSWIYDNVELNQQRLPEKGLAQPESRRALHDAEKAALTIDAQGYLIQLGELGILDQRTTETVLERVVMTGYEKLEVAELREIVAAVLFASGGNTPLGGRPTLNNGDTVH